MLKEILRFRHDNGDVKYVLIDSHTHGVAIACDDYSLGEQRFFSVEYNEHEHMIKEVERLIVAFVDEEDFYISLIDHQFFSEHIYEFNDESAIENLLNHFGISRKVAMMNQIKKECEKKQ